MKKAFFSIVLLFVFFSSIFSQDTTIVQTLTYDSTGRSYIFSFPTDTGQNYEKILMHYSMRCKGANVSTGSDRNKGCGEWDYSCNTFITDSTQIDSVKAFHPSYIIPGFLGDSFVYTYDTVYSYYRYTQFNQNYTSIILDSSYIIGNGIDSLIEPFGLQSKTAKVQYLFTASELKESGLKEGNISGMGLDFIDIDGIVDFLRIKIKEVPIDSLDVSKPILDGFTEVYFKNTILHPDINRFDFYKDFEWDGISNLLVELSYTNKSMNESIKLKGGDTGGKKTLISKSDDCFLNFSGTGKLFLNNTDFSSIDKEITVSFWVFGNPDKLPANTSGFEGVDDNNKRQVNAHLPWSNSRVYWDCGREANSYDRIDKAANKNEIKGYWHYWTFTKNVNSGKMKIYLDGKLWHFGIGKSKAINIKKMVFGSSYNNSYNYFGFMDDISVWDKELSLEEIKTNMYGKIDDGHSNYSNLIAYFNLNNDFDNTVIDGSSQKINGLIAGIKSERGFRGNMIFKGFEISKFRPNLTFYQGEYEKDVEELVVLDSVQKDINLVYRYKLDGTDVVLEDSLFVFEAGYTYIYDGNSNVIIDSLLMSSDGVFNIEKLQYYNKQPSKLELMSFVTPYGIGLDLGEEGKTWEFDVTDFKPILTGKKRLDVYFGKYQEELDIKFLFIKGTPPRNVNGIQQIWKAGAQRNYKDLLSDRFFEPRVIMADANSSMFKIRAAITGHGQEGEFIGRKHYININGGNKEFDWRVWKECADNPIYPQGGTWIYDRAGWCPGAPTNLKEMELSVEPGESFTVDYGINTASGDSRYLINCQLVSYGEPNFTTDAAIVDITRPTQKIEYARFNPICFDPIVIIQNTGSEELKSLDIEYRVRGGIMKTFNWQGNLIFLEKEEVTLPVEITDFWQGDGSNLFEVSLSNPNGKLDEYSNNNYMSSKFVMPDMIENKFIMVLRTNARANENKLVLKNLKGDVIITKDNLLSYKKYEDKLELAEGCYELELTDTGNDGLSFWANPSQGSGKLYFRRKNFSNIKYFNPDFGKFIKYYFLVGNSSKVDDEVVGDIFDIFPNPTTGSFDVNLIIEINKYSKIKVTDIRGTTISVFNAKDLRNGKIRVNLEKEAKGIYMVMYKDERTTITKKIVVQ